MFSHNSVLFGAEILLVFGEVAQMIGYYSHGNFE
jgi:hypothetical protein